MGTFHQDRGEWHGITVVVRTNGPTVYVGRHHHEVRGEVELLDVDVFEQGHDPAALAAYLKKSAQWGVWKKHDKLHVPVAQIAEITRLSDYRT